LGKLRWQKAPLAARAQQVQHRAEHLVQVQRRGLRGAPDAAKQRLYLCESLAADVTGVRLSFHPPIVWCREIVNRLLERLTKLSVAALARRCVAGSTNSTTRRGNDAIRVLLAALNLSLR